MQDAMEHTVIHITETIALDDREVEERFVRATGSRGQNVRKEATAVELRFDIGRSSLPPDVKRRLIDLGGRRVTTDRVLVVVSRADRSQIKNRESARARLLALVKQASTRPAQRTSTAISPTARRRRAALKQRRSALKRARHIHDSD
jgi:ribosome-associated protein